MLQCSSHWKQHILPELFAFYSQRSRPIKISTAQAIQTQTRVDNSPRFVRDHAKQKRNHGKQYCAGIIEPWENTVTKIEVSRHTPLSFRNRRRSCGTLHQFLDIFEACEIRTRQARAIAQVLSYIIRHQCIHVLSLDWRPRTNACWVFGQHPFPYLLVHRGNGGADCAP